MIYLELFWSFFQVGLFSIGGGYAAMPLIQDQVVDIHPWLTMTGFADIMAIAEMTPGPIALNAATFVGIQVAGLPGALSCHYRLYLSILCHCDDFGLCVLPLPWLEHCAGGFGRLRPAVIAMIASAGISLMILALYGQRTLPADLSSFDLMALVIFLAGFFRPAQVEAQPNQGYGGCRRGRRCVVQHHGLIQNREDVYEMNKILAAWAWNGPMSEPIAYGEGHINQTYAVTEQATQKTLYPAKNQYRYIQDPAGLMENICGVTDFLREKAKQCGADPERATLHVALTKAGKPYYKAADGGCWRVYDFVENTVCLQQVQSAEDFYQSAVAFGNFPTPACRLPGKHPA